MKQKRLNRLAVGLRIGLVLVLIALQIFLVVLLVDLIAERALLLYFFIQFIAVVDIFILASRRQNISYTIAWVLLILLLPVTGHLLYILWGRRRKHRSVRRAIARTADKLQKDPAIYQTLGATHPERKRLGGYLGRMGFPIYQNTNCTYYPVGELQFRAMLDDIASAKHFIFLEYFILGAGQLWDEFRTALAQKAAEGVEIRVMYDDLGSLLTLPRDFEADLKKLGIEVICFNPIHHSVSRLYVNYRDHRKICVIDGEIAYTGGTNLADEYANYTDRLGHWKDTAIRLTGDAVWSKTVFFLQLWEAQSGTEQDFDAYRRQHPDIESTPAGFFQPFADGPMNNPDNPAEIIYRSVIHNAREYLYIMTPYLVIDSSMLDALTTAALGGVDVRIITPYIWDKWYMKMVTHSNFGPLLRAGVRIYEYTPGYLHAKTILSDDDHAVTGSINMDYRSFYLSYENGVWICGAPVLADIKADFLDTIAKSKEIQPEDWKRTPLYYRILQGLLRVFASFL